MPQERATANLPLATSVDEVVGNKNQEGVMDVVRVSVSSLAAQIETQRGRGYITLADLQADLGWPEGTEARVWGDPLLANRGIYQKSGVIGAGAWTLLGPLPTTDISHSLRVPEDEFINEFPDAATRAGTVPMFDPVDGQPTTGPTASEIANAQANATQAALDRAAAEAAQLAAEAAQATAEQAAIDAANTVLGNAASIDFAPSGTVAADKVQTAIEELDGDIQAKANASDLAATDVVVAALNTSLGNVSTKADANEADITTLQSQQFGVGQTLQDFTGSRLVNTDYQNNTGKPIGVFIRWGTAGGVPFEASADGVTWVIFGTSNGTAGTSVAGIVPHGYFYRVGGAISISVWTELR